MCQDVNAILDKYAVGMRICREGMYDGDELVLEYLGIHKDGTGGPLKKGKKGDILDN